MENKPKDAWDIKFLREQPFMAFGSLCNLIGQAYRGKAITEVGLEELAKQAFRLAQEFTKEAFDIGTYKPKDLTEEQIKARTDDFQGNYNKQSKMDELTGEEGNLPTIEVDK